MDQEEILENVLALLKPSLTMIAPQTRPSTAALMNALFKQS